MRELPCLCGNDRGLRTVFEQNFSLDELSPRNFSARGDHDYAAKHLHYRIVRCPVCGQMFSTPILDDGAISAHYRESIHDYSSEHGNIIRSYLEPLRRRGVTGGPGSRAIEVGCGSGYVLEALRDLGFADLAGVEPSRQAVAQAPEWVRPCITNDLFEQADFAPRSADLICAFQVLDHFVDPAAVLSRFFEVLKPRGQCYAIIHDEQALHVKLFADRSPIIDVSHIYYFNRKTLRSLFERAGFIVEDIFAIWNRYTIGTWLRMLPVPAKPLLERVLRGVGLARASFAVPAGNIGILARKP